MFAFSDGTFPWMQQAATEAPRRLEPGVDTGTEVAATGGIRYPDAVALEPATARRPDALHRPASLPPLQQLGSPRVQSARPLDHPTRASPSQPAQWPMQPPPPLWPTTPLPPMLSTSPPRFPAARQRTPLEPPRTAWARPSSSMPLPPMPRVPEEAYFGDDDFACADDAFLADLDALEAAIVAQSLSASQPLDAQPHAGRRLSFAEERALRAQSTPALGGSQQTLSPPEDAPRFSSGVPDQPQTGLARTIDLTGSDRPQAGFGRVIDLTRGGERSDVAPAQRQGVRPGLEPWLNELLRPHQREGVQFLLKALVEGNRSPLGVQNSVCFGAILADFMGLGKTLTSLAALYAMVAAGHLGGRGGRKALLVAPPSLLGQWSSEIKKFFGTRLPHLVAANGNGGKKAIHALQDFKKSQSVLLLTSYDLVIRDEAIALLNALPLELLICDEGQRLKNPKAKAYTLLNGLPCKRRLVLTGTPLQNDLWEFFALVTFVGAGPFVGTKAQFLASYVKPIERAQGENAGRSDKSLADERLTQLRERLQPIMLRRGAEVNRALLPPLVQLVVCCALTDVQADLYAFFLKSRAVRDAKHARGRLRSDAGFAAIKLLQKTCAHPFQVYFAHNDQVSQATDDAAVAKRAKASDGSGSCFDSDGDCGTGVADGAAAPSCAFPLAPSQANGGSSGGPPAPRGGVSAGISWPDGFDPHDTSFLWVWSGKLVVLRQMLLSFHAHGEKAVVASTFTTVLDLLEDMCVQMQWPVHRLDGKVQAARRTEIVEEFNSRSSRSFVFLLSTKAGGSGLNLVGASRLVLCEPDWNPATDKQVCGRVWRPGQTAPCVHTYRLLSACTLEERMYSRQLKKLELEGVARSSSDGAAAAYSVIGDVGYFDGLFEPSTSHWSDVFELMGDTQTRSLEHLPQALLEGAVNFEAGRWVSHIHQIQTTD